MREDLAEAVRDLASTAGANDRCELGVNTERAQDLADVGSDGRDGDHERSRDLTGILAGAEQVQHFSLPWRRLLHRGSGRN